MTWHQPMFILFASADLEHNINDVNDMTAEATKELKTVPLIEFHEYFQKITSLHLFLAFSTVAIFALACPISMAAFHIRPPFLIGRFVTT